MAKTVKVRHGEGEALRKFDQQCEFWGTFFTVFEKLFKPSRESRESLTLALRAPGTKMKIQENGVLINTGQIFEKFRRCCYVVSK